MTAKQHVLAALNERDVDLPEDGLTLEKIRKRAYACQFEQDESLSFRIERHPTMYLSDALPGLDASPARFHVVTEYQLDLTEDVWRVKELTATFEYEPWMVVEAELGDHGAGEVIRNQIEEVKASDDPDAVFNEEFGSLINHWKDKFDEFNGRKVPTEDKEAIVELLVKTLKERTGLD